MADSIREQVFSAIKTTVAAIDGVGQVSRGKIDPLAIQLYPAVFILPGFDQVSDDLNTLVNRDMQVFLFLWLRSQDGELHQVMEAFLPKIQQAMAADHTLGGVSIDLSETAIDAPFPLSDDQSEAGVVMEYLVKYRTRRDDPYAIA